MVVKLTGFETLPSAITTYPIGRIAPEGFIAESGPSVESTGGK